ncbi:coatomer subunit beta-2-like [Brachypodium distachyon]|uniref:Clathrin/coatomer adaptor adaptin-like N-terminal domain-containing protein n=1 Tax=Brachypodium distachyon TaxID=15368 RepID=A0A0Q3KNZ9_BRADI|nr:coatomer subunit beta-2-like [Brachypodium distachyon]KQJ81621.2 hypothetical protein BRADI_5g01832v3 [Brachypodium distachyon]|eukprot:XP_024311698.1 coatomer subunit beta-2-like [Brachypodium distachyon]
MEHQSPCSEFAVITSTLEGGDNITRISAMNQTVVPLTMGVSLPDAVQLHRLIASLSSILCQSHNNITINRVARNTLKAIRACIINARMMDPLAHYNALKAINNCWEDEAFGYILRDPVDLRSLTVQAQQGALKILCACLPRLPGNVNDMRCVVAFVSLLTSVHTDIVCGCADALLSLSPFVPGFACAITKAYYNCLSKTPPLQIDNVITVLDRLRQLSSAIKANSDVDNVAICVLRALVIRDHVLQQKILDLAVDILNPRNVENIVQLVRNEMDPTVTNVEYRDMLQKTIDACYIKYLMG